MRITLTVLLLTLAFSPAAARQDSAHGVKSFDKPAQCAGADVAGAAQPSEEARRGMEAKLEAARAEYERNPCDARAR